MGGVAFLFLAALVVLAGLLEFYGLARAWGSRPFTPYGAVLGAGLVVSAFLSGALLIVAAAAAAALCFVPGLARRSRQEISRGAVTAAGVLYVGFLGAHMVALREGPAAVGLDYKVGFVAVMAVFASTWCCDSAAYVVGSAIGKHKLIPAISPGKTWEGGAAGLAGAVAGIALVKWLAGGQSEWTDLAIIGISIGVLSQMGDLVESALKRRAGKKDSSGIIPGHGGVLDRFDGFLFAAPAAYYFMITGGFAVLR